MHFYPIRYSLAQLPKLFRLNNKPAHLLVREVETHTLGPPFVGIFGEKRTKFREIGATIARGGASGVTLTRVLRLGDPILTAEVPTTFDFFSKRR